MRKTLIISFAVLMVGSAIAWVVGLLVGGHGAALWWGFRRARE